MSHQDALDALHASLLADVKAQPDYAAGAVPSISAYSEGAEHALDTIRAQGWRPPVRVIETAEDLKTVYEGAVLLDRFGEVWSVDAMTGRLFTITDGNDDTYDDDDIELPATVIHEP